MIVDFDGLICDINVVNFCSARGSTSKQIPEDEREIYFAAAGGAQGLMKYLEENGGAGMCPEALCKFCHSQKELAGICKPHFGAIRFIQQVLSDKAQSCVYFVTFNREFVDMILDQKTQIGAFLTKCVHADSKIKFVAANEAAKLCVNGGEAFCQSSQFAKWAQEKLGIPPTDTKIMNSIEDIITDTTNQMSYPPKVTPGSAMNGIKSLNLERCFWDDYICLSGVTIFKGKIVEGFKRGSAELGIPTANMDNTQPSEGPPLPIPGVYLGFAEFRGDVYKAVMSYGYNPFYKNAVMTLEAHLLATFERSLIDEQLTLYVIGATRAEAPYGKMAHLIAAIQNDCEAVWEILCANESSFLELLPPNQRRDTHAST